MNPIYLSPSRELPAKGDPGVLFGNVFIPVTKVTPMPSGGLLSYYPLKTNGDDISGNGQHLIITGSPVFNAAGVSGFTGSDYLSLPTALLAGASAWTISMKIKITASSRCIAYYAKGTAANPNRNVTLINANGSQSGWFVSYAYAADSSAFTLISGVEYHILFTWNGSTFTCKINNEQRAVANYSDYAGCGITEHVLGFSPYLFDAEGYGAFNGSIRDVCFYNRVLNDDEQLLLYERI